MAAVLILQLQPGLLNLTMRRTNVFVHEQLHLTPLSVSADRIAHVAFRCVVLLRSSTLRTLRWIGPDPVL